MAPLLRATPNCWICGRPVQLESYKIEEHGQPVHEDCYIAKRAPDKGKGSLPEPSDSTD